MKRLTTIEYWVVALGAIIALVGIILIVWPQPGVFTHFTNSDLGTSSSTMFEKVTESGSRVRGVIMVLAGAGMAALAAYRGRPESK